MSNVNSALFDISTWFTSDEMDGHLDVASFDDSKNFWHF